MRFTYQNIDFTNGLIMHICTSGEEGENKKNVLLLHGFPELSFSFRHVMRELSKHGFYCIAPDQRGYGKTSYKTHKESYLNKFSVLNLTRDIFVLLKNLGIKKVNIIGHDFGSYVSCYFSLMYPSLVESIIIMSMPFGGAPTRNNLKSKDISFINGELLKLSPPRKHYQKYFASKEALTNINNCKQGMFKFLKAYFYFKSRDYKENKPFELDSFSALELSKMPEYYIMKQHLGIAETVAEAEPKKDYKLSWLKDKELKIYSDNFIKSNIKGPLNWYKVMISNSEKVKIADLKLEKSIKVPALFIAGEADWGPYQKPGELDKMTNVFFKNFYGIKIIRNAGHWVQQENSKSCVKEILNFYKIAKISYI